MREHHDIKNVNGLRKRVLLYRTKKAHYSVHKHCKTHIWRILFIAIGDKNKTRQNMIPQNTVSNQLHVHDKQ